MDKKIKYHNLDSSLLFVVLLLVGIGIVMVFSSSAIMAEERFSSPYILLFKQIGFTVIGLILMFYFIKTDYRLLHKFVPHLLIFSIILLVVVLFGKGVRRWIKIGPFICKPIITWMILTLSDASFWPKVFNVPVHSCYI